MAGAAAVAGTAAVAAAPAIGAGTAAVSGVALLYNHAYDEGHSDGYKSGYTSASDAYKEKFQKQAEAFTKERNKAQEEIDGYRALCYQYEALIRGLEEKPDKTEEESKILNWAYADYGKLKLAG